MAAPGFSRLIDTLPAPKSPVAKEKDLRAMAIAADKLASGKTITELAEAYNMSRQAVRDALQRADQAGFYDEYRKAILVRLVPKALATYEAHLERGSLEAARDILQFLQKATQSPQEAAVDTIEAYRLLRVTRQQIEPPSGPRAPQEALPAEAASS